MPPKDYRETKVCFMTDNGIVLPPMDEILELNLDSELIEEEVHKCLIHCANQSS